LEQKKKEVKTLRQLKNMSTEKRIIKDRTALFVFNTFAKALARAGIEFLLHSC